MAVQRTTLSWCAVAGGWWLRVADSTVAGPGWLTAVPTAVSDALAESGGFGATCDPAEDLLRLEGRLRRQVAELERSTAWLREAVQTARADVGAASGLPGMVRFRHRRHLAQQVGDAVDELTAGVEELDEARGLLRAVRDFVIAVQVPDGVLAGAAAGWQRDPARPGFVALYASEAAFVAADPQRAIVTGGESFGAAWRRDGDDAADVDEPAAGHWRLGYLPATGEVYASRRGPGQDRQVWLLARGLTDRGATRSLLTALTQHMSEPNSLIHAAHTLHDAAHTQRTAGTDRVGGSERRR